MNNDITAVKGIKVGHAANQDDGTGCTVVLAEGNFTIGADVRGGAPGTREIALTDSRAAVDKANAIFLSGGSAFGLDAAGGVMKYLKEKNIGFQTGGGVVPIVPTAVIYDLEYKSNNYPDQKMAYQACLKADNIEQPNKSIGAAAGATCGKIKGMDSAAKTVMGHAAVKNGILTTAALAVVNAFGDIKNPNNGQIIAGAKNNNGNFLDTEKMIIEKQQINLDFLRQNTTLIVLTTNAILNKSEANRVSMMAHSALSRTIYPVHTLLDGDTVFTLASNQYQADLNQIGVMAAEAVKKAIISAAD
ncbi:MAG: peptidase S58 DmpA [Halanaerobium sp. 4-GBenrich]|jgi:L-aminopeptidase/D-esterase-like protein|uniref:L-aminopeptidase/D-esterase n=1 Tax=Halanaerobium congolense TaxID=54121 RepID=A0A1G9WY67_9FIRM|nr:P1 family peptidase [Halanaerobium congolense]ODS49854.1 MAG: peptidase S58 DmpA [Halanaerobium sp. 4-GBenrich]PUU93502.1 MAG: peptidase S58 DmpA [Halanaerobium sp.]TDX46683.1 L-aminopeptidase/D-esterase-like protein [Halanaerobium congolense]SDI31006.1 L-aminopeptidase/D-esterase [Halanaerobium congolense]SDK43326.1 L-aminopeptidase/D-esterase [Halanaerobium congolense]